MLQLNMDNQISLENTQNQKLLIAFDYNSAIQSKDITNQVFNDDVFYAEEIEVQDNIIHEGTVEGSYPPIEYIQNEITIRNDSSLDIDGSSYQEVIQSLIPLAESTGENVKTRDAMNRYLESGSKQVAAGEKLSSFQYEVNPTKSFFGSSMGVSRCPICQKFTKRSSIEEHMKEHYSNQATAKDELNSSPNNEITVTSLQPFNVVHQEVVTTNGSFANSEEFNFQINTNYNTTENDYSIKCFNCDYFAPNLENLQIHLATTHTNGELKCTQCKFIASNSDSLISHIAIHEQRNFQWQCSFCDFCITDANEFDRHCERHYKGNSLKCHFCSYIASNAAQKKNHMKCHYGDKPFVCPICDYRSVDRSSLVEHVRVHNGDKPHHCTLCSFKCIQKASLKAHMRTNHPEPDEEDSRSTFECDICNFTTKRKTSLYRHSLLHAPSKPYKCNECSYESNQKAAYNAHLQRHRGEKPHKCPQCSYSSVEKTHLTRHIRQHTGEKPIFCFVCNYRCIQFGCLVAHYKRHNGANIQCAFCAFNTSSADVIINHLRSDHKRCWHKTAFQICTICGTQFADRQLLAKHKKAEHSDHLHNDLLNSTQCDNCDFVATSKKTLKVHRKKEHL